MDYLLLLVVGIALILTSIPNFKGNISTVHRYNRRRVSEADAPRYGRAMGLGTVIMGVSSALTAILQLIFDWEPILSSGRWGGGWACHYALCPIQIQ